MIDRVPDQNRTPLPYELLIAGFGLLALLAVQWMLATVVHGTNYDGGDGKMAQATILAAIKFGAPFHVSNISPIEGVGSQLLPMNVWGNPAYWPFHFLDKALAADVSALIALACFASACYIMARCFDIAILPSVIAAQLCIVLFAPMVLILDLPTVFCLTPGNAVAYAPHLVAFGLVARLEPGPWRSFALFTAALFALLFYSLYCDPLWTLVDGISWALPFAIVIFCPPRLSGGFSRAHVRQALVRCAALGSCLLLFLLLGPLEYLYTLSRFTARVQFPAVADRPRMFEFVSTAFYSPSTKYFYIYCALGWLLGLLTLRGRTWVLALAATMTCGVYLIYSAAFLLLNVPWTAPIPTYVEQCLLPLYLTAGVAGFWGALRYALAVFSPLRLAVRHAGQTVNSSAGRVRRSLFAVIQRARLSALRRGSPRLTVYLMPLARLLGDAAMGIPAEAVGRSRSSFQRVQVLMRGRFATLAASFFVVALIPAGLANFALLGAVPYAEVWHEPWPNEPELQKYFSDNIGRTPGQPVRGSVAFYTYGGETAFTIISAWVNGIHTVDEYSQLVTPQAVYVLHALLQNNVTGSLNGFVPFPGTSWDIFFKVLQLFGVRFYVADAGGASIASQAGYQLVTMPRRPLIGEPGLWQIYELPHPNVGNYTPTDVVTAATAPDMIAAMRSPGFDFARQVVLLAPRPERLLSARDMRFSLVPGGFHLSGHSDGTSLVVLPIQYSHCLRARDDRVRIVRADFFMTGVIFTGAVDTDVRFDYGLFTPGCRRADLADMRSLQVNVDSRMPHLSGDRLFPDRSSILAKLRDAVRAIK